MAKYNQKRAPEEKRRPRFWRIFSDLSLSIFSALLIVLLVVLLSTLIRWVVQDVDTTFAGITKDINDALVLDGSSPGTE